MKLLKILALLLLTYPLFSQSVNTVYEKDETGRVRVRIVTTDIADDVSDILLPQLDDTIANRIVNAYDTLALGVNPEWWGLSYGTNKTEAVQKANQNAWESACEYAASRNYFVSLGLGNIQIWSNAARTVTIPTGQTLSIRGKGKTKTVVEFFPRVKPFNTGEVRIFTLGVSSNIDIEGVGFHSEWFKVEDYNAAFVVGVDSTKLIVTEGTKRVGFMDSIVGKTIYTSSSYEQLEAYQFTVIARSGDTLTLSGKTNYPTTQTGRIGVLFPSYLTNVDTLRRYGEYWRAQSTSGTHTYLIYMISAAGNNYNTFWNFKDVKLSGFENAITNSGGLQAVTFTDCDMSSPVQVFSYFNTSVPSRVVTLNHCHVHDSGTNINGGNLPGNDIPGYTYGGVMYLHDNVSIIANDVRFTDNTAATIRQRSSDGLDTVTPEQFSSYTNCIFSNNSEYHVYTSRRMPVRFVNCMFYNGTCNFMWDVIADNCVFSNTLLGTAGASSVKPRIQLSNCTITNESRLNFPDCNRLYLKGCRITPHLTNNTISTAGIEDFRMTDCVIEASATPYSYFFDTILPEKGIFDNCEFGNLGSSVYWNRTNVSFWVYTSTIAVRDIMKFSNCQINGALWKGGALCLSNVGLASNCTFTNPVSNTWNHWDDFEVRKAQSNAIQSPSNVNFNGATHPTLSLSVNYNSFLVRDSIVRIYLQDGSYTRQFADEVTLRFDTFCVIRSYAQTTNSNLLFGGNYDRDSIVTMRFDSRKILGTGVTPVTNDVVFTGNGVLTSFSEGESVASDKIIPNSVVLTCGSVVLTDNNEGILTGAGGSGYIDYETKMLLVKFDVAPSNGVNCTLDYDEYTTVHHKGAWVRTN